MGSKLACNPTCLLIQGGLQRTHYGYWTWESNPSTTIEFSSVPISNFFGWFVVVLLMLSLFVVFAFRKDGAGEVITRMNTSDSRIAYGLLLIDAAVANETLGHYLVVLIGVFAMGAFLIIVSWGNKF